MAHTDIHSNWDAASYFKNLVEHNVLAQQQGYRFARVSGLQGLEDFIAQSQSAKAAVCVSDISPGYTDLNNTPHSRRVKTIFLMRRHAIDNMEARTRCMDELRELFRQMMSVLFKERTRLEQGVLYFDPRIQFTEIEQYFATGCACAYFQVAFDIYTDLIYRKEEWLSD